MNPQLEKFKEVLLSGSNINSVITTNNESIVFKLENNLLIPEDLVEYFKFLNGKIEDYNDKFFQFCSFTNFKSIDEDLKNWGEIPDYRNIINTLNEHESFYVFADYCFHLFSYAIKLHSSISDTNEVVVIAGDEYKVIANSFSEFVELYLNDSIELYFNEEG